MARESDHVSIYGSIVEKKYRIADGVKRADAKLRSFAPPRREGDAVFCAECDGAGYVERSLYSMATDRIRKCGRCGGEGLEPKG